MHSSGSGMALLPPGEPTAAALGISIAVGAWAEGLAMGAGMEASADLVFAGLDAPAASAPATKAHWLILQPQAPALREALMLAAVAHAAVYLPPALQLGLAWLARQQRGVAGLCGGGPAALGEQLAGWVLALRRLPTCVPRARRGDPHAALLARAREAVQGSLASPASLDDMAAAAGLGRSQLNRTLRRGCGLSAGRYRSELRLRRAAMRVLIDGQRCAEAAREVGYRSNSQFSGEFARLYGVRPSRLVGLVEALLGEPARAA